MDTETAGWPYDAYRDDPLTALRIPVIGTPYPLFVVTAPRSLDQNTAGPFRAELRAAVSHHETVAVDLEAVEFMDSYGLGALVGALHVARYHDCEMTVVCTREPILRIFRLTTMDKVLDVRPTLEACYG